MREVQEMYPYKFYSLNSCLIKNTTYNDCWNFCGLKWNHCLQVQWRKKKTTQMIDVNREYYRFGSQPLAFLRLLLSTPCWLKFLRFIYVSGLYVKWSGSLAKETQVTCQVFIWFEEQFSFFRSFGHAGPFQKYFYYPAHNG